MSALQKKRQRTEILAVALGEIEIVINSL